MTHVRIWKFRPSPDRKSAFAAAYAEDGPWSRLFAGATGYQGTKLLGPAEQGGWWLTIDAWDSEEAFDAFQRDYGEQYRALDAALEGLAGHEEFVGAFKDDR
jgi:quinol monooxygenase YgiN